ncbi:hypothetical protein ACFSBZ_16295 [Amnibacterium flavum]|uniref:Uncharacterized protein n=1 Tax=Amnibacterium flavum TaxID=2173173 RepID=A0A2V1HLG7_9MICO|nr:hypothetical protein [Amnibacterium flavum]PVZ93285.1 hypothetical protein DDQ50_16430 [Amnibacterium flavum]
MDPRGGVVLSFVLVPVLVFGAAIFVMFFGSNSASACAPGVGQPIDVARLPTDASAGDLDREQIVNAALIVNAAIALGMDSAGQILGVQAALGESSLRVLDSGDVAGPDSRGLFQQRDNGAWGSYEDRMDPTVSATNFFAALQRVTDWESLEPSLAINSVQRNADPSHYKPYRTVATGVVSYLAQLQTGKTPGTPSAPTATCDVAGDARTLATDLVTAIEDGTLTIVEPRYADQIRDVADGTATPNCELDVRTLQIITIALKNFTRVGVSDLNRQCTGMLLGAGTTSSHWIGNGGRAVDFYSLAGLPVTGGDARSLQLLAILDPMVPAGTRAGQVGCRPATALQHFTQFTDSCDHLHLDVAYTDDPLVLS